MFGNSRMFRRSIVVGQWLESYVGIEIETERKGVRGLLG